MKRTNRVSHAQYQTASHVLMVQNVPNALETTFQTNQTLHFHAKVVFRTNTLHQEIYAFLVQSVVEDVTSIMME